MLVKLPLITSPDVSTHFQLVLKKPVGGLNLAEAPLSAISRSSRSPESTGARWPFNAARGDGSWFLARSGTANSK